MVKKSLAMAPVLIACFCVATVLAQFIGLGMLWSRGGLEKERIVRVLAAVHDVDLTAEDGAEGGAAGTVEDEQAALRDVVQARAKAGLDIDLRESALRRGRDDLANLEKRLRTDHDRFNKLKQAYDERLSVLEGERSDDALRDMQRILELMQPKQAKDQILRMLENNTNPNDDVMQDVVTILKLMRDDKRKKIIGEFRTGDEPDKFEEILREIRLGNPEVGMIQQARQDLGQLDETPVEDRSSSTQGIVSPPATIR